MSVPEVTDASGTGGGQSGGLGGDRDIGAIGGLRVVEIQSKTQNEPAGDLASRASVTVPRELGMLNVFVVNGGVRLPAALMEEQK